MVTTWAGDREGKPAPGDLRRVQSLINTVDLESGRDRLALPADAHPWLVDNGWLAPGAGLAVDDLRFLIRAREALRALIVHNGGGVPPDPTVAAVLTEVAAAGTVRASVEADGRVALDADGESLRARSMALLLILRDAQRDGSWSHLKACANDDCRWAFYDRSRNHGGTWCDMSTCGNKLKNRDFRARRRGESN